MAKDKKDLNPLVIGTAGGLATKGAISLINKHKVSKGYKTYEEFASQFDNVQKGDVLTFQGSFADEKIHPIIITEPKGRHSRFLEMHPDSKSLVREDILSNRLEYLSQSKKGFDSSKATKVFSGLYRDKDFNEAKFDSVVKTVGENKHKYEYNPLKTTFNLEGCGKGTCATFIDSISRGSSDLKRAKAILPADVTKSLTQIVKPKAKVVSNPSLLLTVPTVAGTSMLLDKNKDNDTMGAVLAGGGAAGLLYKPVRSLTTLSSGFGSYMIGDSFQKHLKGIELSNVTKRSLGAASVGVPLVLATNYLLNKKNKK